MTRSRKYGLGCVQIYFSPEKFRQFLFHRKECQPGYVTGRKLNQHIEITVGTDIAMEN